MEDGYRSEPEVKDTTEQPRVFTREQRPADHSLGLCKIENVLTPDQLADLHRDLASLALARRTLPKNWDTERIG